MEIFPDDRNFEELEPLVTGQNIDKSWGMAKKYAKKNQFDLSFR